MADAKVSMELEVSTNLANKKVKEFVDSTSEYMADAYDTTIANTQIQQLRTSVGAMINEVNALPRAVRSMMSSTVASMVNSVTSIQDIINKGGHYKDPAATNVRMNQSIGLASADCALFERSHQPESIWLNPSTRSLVSELLLKI